MTRGGGMGGWGVIKTEKDGWIESRVGRGGGCRWSVCCCKLNFCPYSLFLFLFCQIFHRHTQNEPPLCEWIKLKPKHRRTRGDSGGQRGKRTISGMSSGIKTNLARGQIWAFPWGSQSSQLRNFKENLHINKWAFGLLDLFKKMLWRIHEFSFQCKQHRPEVLDKCSVSGWLSEHRSAGTQEKHMKAQHQGTEDIWLDGCWIGESFVRDWE